MIDKLVRFKNEEKKTLVYCAKFIENAISKFKMAVMASGGHF